MRSLRKVPVSQVGTHLIFPKVIVAITLFVSIVPTGAANFSPQNESVDHQAHAKPGGPYFSVDWNGDGLDAITLDATQSHTHFYDYGPPARSGSIVRYQWYSQRTGRKLLDTQSPYLTANFFLGITVLKLVVTDNTGDQAHAYTYVSVRRPYRGERREPSIASIRPAHGPLSGGTRVTILGSAFHNNPRVAVYVKNDDKLYYYPIVISETKLVIIMPRATQPSSVVLRVENSFGISTQRVIFRYEISGQPAVYFEEYTVKHSDGTNVNLPGLTCIAISPDRHYYAGSRDGFIHVLEIDRKMVLRTACKSPSVGESRTILGLAFDPADAYTPNALSRIYISTSALAWLARSSFNGWDNGQVELWVRRPTPACLSHEHTVISGLPVSAGDHGVNALVFQSDGILLVSVGGTTNAGVYRNGEGVSAVPESPLSGAVLTFNLRAPNFNGFITYTQPSSPGETHIKSGTVGVFASGLRNVFGMTYHSNGNVYAMDNGPNIGFGAAATGCYNIGDDPSFSDEFIHLQRDAYYGHPNWNRARDDPRQCTYIPGNTPTNVNYTAPLFIVPSSTTGIMEYAANRFGSALQGCLLLSKLTWSGNGVLTRVDLSDDGKHIRRPPVGLYDNSGIAVVMGPFGEIVMPKMKEGTLVGLLPVESWVPELRVISVLPPRGRIAGGNFVLVTGDGFNQNIRIMFAGVECLEYNWLQNENQVLCSVPPYKGGTHAVHVVAERQDGVVSSPSKKPQYEYMII